MELVFDIFRERKREIKAHIDFIRLHEKSLGSIKIPSTPEQYQILLACAYILIYNMIEATILKFLEILEQELFKNISCPYTLIPELKKEWVKNELGTSEQLTTEKRLDKAMKFLEFFSGQGAFKIKITSGGGGNWDDEAIYELSKRLGIDLSKIPKKVTTGVKRHIVNNMGCIKLVVDLRNKLAHGGISFCECGKDRDLKDVEQIFKKTCAYIEGVISSFKRFIDEKNYIIKNNEQLALRAS